MSKKNKKKLEKRLIAERLRMLETETKGPKIKKTTEKTKETSKPKEKKIDQKDEVILKDIKRMAAVALIMLLILATLFLLKLKTSYLTKASDEILSFLHIGQF